MSTPQPRSPGGSGADRPHDPDATVMRPSDPPPPAPRPIVDAEGDGELDLPTERSLPPQDLSRDALLALAPRHAMDGLTVPVLGGVFLVAKIGQGGMGAVYYGLHSRLRKEVALKVLPPNLAEQDPDLMKRFFREAQIACRVSSPHVVNVLDVNRDEASGLCYLVMEYVRGTSAGGVLKQVQKDKRVGLDEATALTLIASASEGLAAAHAEGIVHRDIKPDNILIPFARGGHEPQFGRSKLADLGLARCGESGLSLTGAQMAMGTPGYLAPEQAIDAKTAGLPADVYGMGATLYALLSGHAPFTGSSAMKIILDTMQNPHRPIRELRPDVSEATAALLERCLQKKPEHRPRDGGALCEELRACRAAPSRSAPRSDAEFTPTVRAAPSPAGPAPSPSAWRQEVVPSVNAAPPASGPPVYTPPAAYAPPQTPAPAAGSYGPPPVYSPPGAYAPPGGYRPSGPPAPAPKQGSSSAVVLGIVAAVLLLLLGGGIGGLLLLGIESDAPPAEDGQSLQMRTGATDLMDSDYPEFERAARRWFEQFMTGRFSEAYNGTDDGFRANVTEADFIAKAKGMQTGGWPSSFEFDDAQTFPDPQGNPMLRLRFEVHYPNGEAWNFDFQFRQNIQPPRIYRFDYTPRTGN
ncbi:MAG: hypothetical protein AMXMBFR7_03200 [Planctomycetota bacterium]